MVTNYIYDTTYINVPFAVHDTTTITEYIHDTTIVDNYIHDTTIVDNYIHDTTIVTEYFFDTTYLWQYDTTVVDNYIYDTTIIDNYIYDTTYINTYIHDTTTVTEYLYDTTYLWQYDTTYINNYIHDTTYINNYIHDTTVVQQYDTVYVTIYDTIITTQFDTVTITHHDTVTITEQLTFFSVSVTSANMAQGVAAGNGSFPDGTELEIAAIPIEGYRFVQWNDGNNDNPRAVTVNEDLSFTASFTTSDVKVNTLDGDDITITTSSDKITVYGATGERIKLFDALGRHLSVSDKAADMQTFVVPTSGAYLLQVGNRPARRVVVIK